MSFDWYRWAKSQRGLSPPEKAVLVTIADYFNDKEGSAWPAQDTLAGDTSYSRATVHRACKSLRQKGLLSWSKTMLPSGHFSSNRYVLHRVAECVVADSHEAKQNSAVLQGVELPCSTVQQKPLSKPLNETLKVDVAEKNKGNLVPARQLSQKQIEYAKGMTDGYLNKYKGEYLRYDVMLQDLCDYLLSDQTDDAWLNIGNGLKSPKELGLMK